MIEIPEAVVLAQQWNQTLRGKRVRNVVANQSPHGFAWFFGDPDDYHRRLAGKTLGKAVPVAGFIDVEVEDMHMTFQDGVNMRLFLPGEPLPKKHQLWIELEDGTSFVCTVQMYGGMMVFPDGDYDDNKYYSGAKAKPSPLTDAFDEAYFSGIVSAAKPNLSIKALLATEQRIPGLGNGVLQDILFRSHLHPKQKINGISDAQWEVVFRQIKDTLAEMAIKGGRDTERDLYGCYGGYQTQLSKNTWKEPCPECGGEIERKAYLGGNVYYCEHCQPLTGK